MSQVATNNKVYHSMTEFEKIFFPKDFQQKEEESPKDASDLGVKWAKDSLKKIKNKL